MLIISLIFQFVGMLAVIFLGCVAIGYGLRLGLGQPVRSPTELERRKDLGKPF